MGQKNKKLKPSEARHIPARQDVSAEFAPLPATGYLSEAWLEFLRREYLKYRIALDYKAHVLFEGNVTQKSIRRLINYLEMSIDDFPQEIKNSTTQD